MKINLSYLVIAVLVIVILLQRSCSPKIQLPEPIIKRDTVYIHIHDTIPGKPVFIKGKIDTVWLKLAGYIPSTRYDSLLEQYKGLGNQYFRHNIYSTKFDIPPYGYVEVRDTISQNQIEGTGLITSLKIPEKTTTITKIEPPKRQLYIGGGITGNPELPVNGIHTGFLYKDKKDQIFGASVGFVNQQVQYGISSYFKIKLRKSN